MLKVVFDVLYGFVDLGVGYGIVFLELVLI
jgi:hypothetical protein